MELCFEMFEILKQMLDRGLMFYKILDNLFCGIEISRSLV